MNSNDALHQIPRDLTNKLTSLFPPLCKYSVGHYRQHKGEMTEVTGDKGGAIVSTSYSKQIHCHNDRRQMRGTFLWLHLFPGVSYCLPGKTDANFDE